MNIEESRDKMLEAIAEHEQMCQAYFQSILQQTGLSEKVIHRVGERGRATNQYKGNSYRQKNRWKSGFSQRKNKKQRVCRKAQKSSHCPNRLLENKFLLPIFYMARRKNCNPT